MALVLPLLVAQACGGDDNPSSTSDAAEGGSEESGGPPHPSFTEPASGRVLFPTTRTSDLTLSVIGILPGITEVLIDGHSFGPLGEGSAIGELDSNELILHVRGSMVAGDHGLSLRTADSTGDDESAVVAVEIGPTLGQLPEVSIDQDTGLPAQRLLVMGDGDDAVLIALDASADPPRLHLIPRTQDGWDPDARRTVVLPGLVLDANERMLPVAAQRYDQSADDAGRARVAWRVGAPGTRVDILDERWEALAETAPPSTSLTLDEAVGTQPFEWAELGRPWLLGDRLLVELLAPRDVESPRPGDRSLVHAKVQPRADGLDPPQRLSIGSELVDVDALGPAIDTIAAATGRPAPISIRVDRTQARLVELDPTSGFLRVRDTEIAAGTDDLAFATLPVASVVGAFGSRTTAGVSTQSGGRVRLSFMDDSGGNGLRSTSLPAKELPDFPLISGEVAPGSVDGLTVFLVPYGDAAPLHVVYAVGNIAEYTTVDALACGSVAIANAPLLNTASTAFACTRDGTLWLGTLTTVAP